MVDRRSSARRTDDAALAAFRRRVAPLFGERLSENRSVRAHHADGEGYRVANLPDFVVFPHSDEEVSEIVKCCDSLGIPVIPFGAGTSLEGQLAANHGGVSLDLSHMNRILEVDVDALDCRVQAGATRGQLNAHLRDTGLFFPLDPGADATIGGMAATRASGTNAVKYGTMSELTLGLTVVTAQGARIKTGGRARKSAAGYDLTRLFVGSEGTLGVITEVQLRLFGQPESILTAVCQFSDLSAAVDTVVAILQLNIQPARIELLDALQMRACIAYSELADFQEQPTLFLEFHGGPAATVEQCERARQTAMEHGGGAFRFASAPEARSRLWTARHNAYHAALALAPGKWGLATDACVPISHLAACIADCEALARRSGLICPIVGHVGDGNFHMLVLYSPEDAGERARAEQLVEEISTYAIAHRGTCSGEHGIGLKKLDALKRQHADCLPAMFAIKQALDPNNTLNPGKTLACE